MQRENHICIRIQHAQTLLQAQPFPLNPSRARVVRNDYYAARFACGRQPCACTKRSCVVQETDYECTRRRTCNICAHMCDSVLYMLYSICCNCLAILQVMLLCFSCCVKPKPLHPSSASWDSHQTECDGICLSYVWCFFFVRLPYATRLVIALVSPPPVLHMSIVGYICVLYNTEEVHSTHVQKFRI